MNPRSSSGRTRERWPAIEARLRDGIGEIDSVHTERLGHATELTRAALRAGIDQIIAVGGDGTVSEVVNGFFADGRPINSEAVLGLVMLGTGGDFRRSLGMTGEVDDYVSRLIGGSVRTIDLGRIELTADDGSTTTRWFDNIASFGVSGEIVDAVNHAGFSKKLGGKFAFHWATIKALIGHRNVPIRIRIDDDFEEELPATVVAVCNGQYFGGGMWIAPHAVVDDGFFDVVTVTGLGALGFVRHSGALQRGTHLDLDFVRVHRGRRLVATPPPGVRVAIDADGETPGILPATFEVVPGALRVRA